MPWPRQGEELPLSSVCERVNYSAILCFFVFVCVRACMCMCACVYAYVYVCATVCVPVYVCT